MKIACPSCQAPFEADAAPAAGPGQLLCEACSYVGDAPPPPIVPSQRPEVIAAETSPPVVTSRRQRPRVPELSFRRSEVKVELAVLAPEAGPPSSEPMPVSFSELEVISTRERSPALHDGGFSRAAQPTSVFPCEPGPMSRRGADLSMDDFASDVEPVSLHDLGVVLAPMAAPPRWSGSAGAQPGSTRLAESAATELARIAALCPAPDFVAPEPLEPPVSSAPEVVASSPPPEASAAPISAPRRRVIPSAPPPPLVEAKADPPRDASDSGIVDLRRIIAAAERRLAAKAEPGEEPVREKPSFFRVDSVPPPPLAAVPVDADLDDAPPSSSRADLLSLVALPSDRPRARAAEDLLHLDGGLFGDHASRGSPAAPDASLLLAPVMSLDRVSRSSMRPPPIEGGATSRSAPPPRVGSTPPPLPVASKVSRSAAPGPVVSERRPAARRSGLVSWAVVLCGVAVAGVALGLRLGTPPPPREEAHETVASTATSPPAVTPAERPVVPAFAPRPVEAPPPPQREEARPLPAPAPTIPVVRAVDPPRPAEPARPAETAPTAKERVVAPPPSVAVPIPVPAVVAPPPSVAAAPPPAGGGEFDRGAAKAALAAAASAAAGCKQGDDPSGGARVSVTFAPSGRVTSARIVSGPFQGTKTGGCIAQTFRAASVPAFSGDAVTVAKEVSVQ